MQNDEMRSTRVSLSAKVQTRSTKLIATAEIPISMTRCNRVQLIVVRKLYLLSTFETANYLLKICLTHI